MSIFLRHLATRLRSMATEPASVAMLIVAGATHLFLWPWILEPRFFGQAAGLGDLHTLMFLLLCPWLASIPAAGRATGTRPQKVLVSWAVPTLPIGRRARVVSEAAAVLVAVGVVRLPGIFMDELGHHLFSFAGPFASPSVYRLEFAGYSLTGLLVMLPLVMAWGSPSRLVWPHLVRVIGATGAIFAALKLGWLTTPLPCIAVGLTVALAVLAVNDLEIEFARRETGVGRRPVALARPPRDPMAQLRRDQWQRPLLLLWPLIAGVALLSVGGLLLDRFVGIGQLARAGIGGLCFGGMLQIIFVPMGINLFKGDQVWSTASFLKGSFAEAWAVLPVRRETVVRGVWLHGLIVSAGLVVAVIAHQRLARLMGVGDENLLPFFLVPMLAAVPILAGLMACVAIGDRVRGYISAVSVLLLLPAQLVTMEALIQNGISPRSSTGVAIDVGALGLLALAGGVPPLVHLRRSAPSKDVAAWGDPDV